MNGLRVSLIQQGLKPTLSTSQLGSARISTSPQSQNQSQNGSNEQTASLAPPISLQQSGGDDQKEEDSLSDLSDIGAAQLEEAVQASINILVQYESRDPVLAVFDFYQQQGYTKLDFTEHRHLQSKFWTTFECPIYNQRFASSLPYPLLSPRTQNDELSRLAERILGDYTVASDTQQVVFASKRGARRAVALAILEELGQFRDLDYPDDLFVSSALHLQGVNETIGPLQRKLPTWVLNLAEWQVRNPKISYRQKLAEQDSGQLFQPTQICCFLSTNSPTKLSVVGMPSPSKHEALSSAVELTIAELKRQGFEKKPLSEKVMKTWSKHFRDSSKVTYAQKLPEWATQDFVGPKVYLYRLEFITEEGHSLVKARTDSKIKSPTPLGIVFPSDPKIQACETIFELPLEITQGAFVEVVTVRLGDRTVLELPSEEQRVWLKGFNDQVADWKTYGKVPNPKKKGPRIAATDRSYCFVPLNSKNLSIDWVLTRRISDREETPLLKPAEHIRFSRWGLSLVLGVPMGLLGLALLLLVFDFKLYNNFWNVISLMNALKVACAAASPHVLSEFNYLHLGAPVVLLLLLLVYTIRWLGSPSRCVSAITLANRVFYEERPTPKVLCISSLDPIVSNGSGKMTSRSKMINRKLVPKPKKKRVSAHLEKYNPDIQNADIAEQYLKLYGIRIKYPHEYLISCFHVSGVCDGDVLMPPMDKDPQYAVPELIRVLPMPRDVLDLLKRAEIFMPKLERAMLLQRWRDQIPQTLQLKAPPLLLTIDGNGVADRSKLSVDLLDEGTTYEPSQRFQKLEFLGDSVLGYFLAINLFARNSDLSSDANDLNDILEHAAKNSTLFGGSMRAGLSMIAGGTSTWKSRYGLTKTCPKPLTLTEEVMDHLMGNHNACTYLDISDKTMSDLVESMLGVLFLGSDSCSGDIAGFFECLDLPIPEIKSKKRSSGWPWFSASNSCVHRPYSFEFDRGWRDQLALIGSSLRDNTRMWERLEAGRKGLYELLRTLSPTKHSTFETESSMVLFVSALFDGLPGNIANGDGLKVKMALLRDSLSLVGGHSLQLCILTDLYKRYPTATEGELDRQKNSVLTPDALAYVMVKAGMEAFLFNKKSKSVKQFQIDLAKADTVGKAKYWKKHGWVLKGGLDEFRKRCTLGQTEPRYSGLAGGRLSGVGKKSSNWKIESLVFSFKAIVGALTLSSGLRGMWDHMLPLMDELLLLRAEELAQVYTKK